MKNLMLTVLLILPCYLFAQIGIKAGINFANVTEVSSINSSNESGYHVGLFLAPAAKSILGSRTELIYSHQGYDYATGTSSGNVNLDYIVLPQFMAINITKFFQIQLGGQMAYLLNAKADSTKNGSSASNPYSGIMEFYNRFIYALGGGVEVHPFKGLLIGARINFGMNNLYKDFDPATSSGTPSFVPKVDMKANVFQIFTGWTFGKGNTSSKSKKKKE